MSYISRITVVALALSILSLNYVLASPPPVQEGTGVSITIGGAPPPPPTPVSPIGGGPGMVHVSNTMAQVSISGYAYPDSMVTISMNGVVVGTTVADQSGLFSKDLSVASGEDTFSVWGADSFGSQSTTANVTIYLAPGTKTYISNIILSPTVSSSVSVARKGSTVKLYGSAPPNSEVTIFSSGNVLGSVKTGNNGVWSFSLDTTGLKPGSYSINAIAQITKNGLISGLSGNLGLSVSNCGIGDLDCDNKVDIVDLSIMLFYWKQHVPKGNPADLNGDGVVDLKDLSILLYFWTG